MATKYSKVRVGSIFEAGGGKFRKVDELYYEDLQSGFQTVWSPVFDDSITSTAADEPVEGTVVNTKDKFVTDPQSRIMKPNPNYQESSGGEAEKWFGEMWGSGEFDCGPEDYEWMALTAIAAVRGLKAIPVSAFPAAEPQSENEPEGNK